MLLNLNADLGESYGAWKMGDDTAMLAIVDSASIACGFHAGDPLGMRRALHGARRQQVSVGAHPSFPDLQGFGRRRMQFAADELEALLLYQLGALAGMARVEEVALTHVKPHGALSNMACEDATLARRVARAVHAFDAGLILLAPAGSLLASAGQQAGLRVAGEIFADRGYAEDGQLLPRSQPGAVLGDVAACVAHVERMLAAGGIVTARGQRLEVPFHSVCVHGDSPHAVQIARAVRAALNAAGCTLRPLPELFAAHRSGGK